METFIILFIISLVSYLLGSIPFALVFNKLFFKQDPRKTGSKNIGALNTLRIGKERKGRVVGVISFLIVFLLDACKGIFAIILSSYLVSILSSSLLQGYETLAIALPLVCFFVILGHNYSAYLKFQGGRGAATLFGLTLYFSVWLAIAWAIITILGLFVGEIMAGHKINNKLFKDATNNQIIGRLVGEVLGLSFIYTFSPHIFTLVALPLLLVLIAHKDRLAEQLKKIKNKTYLPS
jgi:acyl-phosphate glycerol 3-phosphate acyltransferase